MRRKRKITTLGVCILFGLILWPVAAQAALVTIEIEAVVDSVDDPFGYLEGKIIVGDIITGFYVYESTTPDSSPLDPVQGNYWHYAAPDGIALTVGGFTFMTDPFNVAFHVAVRNNSLSGDDSYWLASDNNLPLSNGTQVDEILWSLRDPTGTALSSDALLTTAPVLDDWGFNRLSFGGGTRARGFVIEGHVTSAIPEPATILLFGLGGLLIGRRR